MTEFETRKILVDWFEREDRWSEKTQEVIGILTRLLDSTVLQEKLDAWVDLGDWYRHGTRRLGKQQYSHDHASNEVIAELLEKVTEIREKFHHALCFILDHTEAIGLFAKAGIPSGRGFISEVVERSLTAVLPAPRDDHNLSKLLWRQFHHESHIDRFQSLPPALFHRMLEVMVPKPDSNYHFIPLMESYADSFRLLAMHVQSEGLSEQLRIRSPHMRVLASPFYLLSEVSDSLMDAWLAGQNTYPIVVQWRAIAKDCRNICRQIEICLETEGVNLDIVTGLEIIDRALTRMEHMMDVLYQPEGFSQSSAIHRLLTELLFGIHHDRSLLYYLSKSTSLLHRKIVDRAGETGEHYLAKDRSEYWHIIVAAAGGGLLTTFTALIKLKLYTWDLPPFIFGVAASLNYAVSFLLMQLFGLVLATKQPAMTAAYLAFIIRDKKGAERLNEIAHFTSSITRAQVGAAVANVTVVSLGAYLVNFLWIFFRHHNSLDLPQAEHVFESLSPFDSGTLFYAALTGVLLWMGSVAGGWFENLMVYYRTAEGIRDHPLGKIVGKERLGRFAESFRVNISGIATNVALGFLLGMTPVFSHFLGVPADVRHVTLSSGQLAFACASLNQDWWHHGWFLKAFLGIATMFILNLSVSFALSLLTAARAYELGAAEIYRVVSFVFVDFCAHPKEFLFPPKK